MVVACHVKCSVSGGVGGCVTRATKACETKRVRPFVQFQGPFDRWCASIPGRGFLVPAMMWMVEEVDKEAAFWGCYSWLGAAVR